ncbi:MAG: lysophospholipid acyltransferase family protein [bacterium]|nr:lysophospholipid acyltransferase family protein [bacterium]
MSLSSKMTIKKKFLRWLKLSIVPSLGNIFLKILSSTWKIRYTGYLSLNEIQFPRKIVAVWHGRLTLTACILRNYGIRVMVSDHEDGEMISRIVLKLGFRPIRGSSTRGGVKGAMSAVEAISNGEIGGMLPDGPLGPRHSAKPGTVWLAKTCDAWIIPVSGSAKRSWQFPKSWDYHILPKPFAEVIFHIGEPFIVHPDTEIRQASRELANRLTEIEMLCDRQSGIVFLTNTNQ